MRIWTSIGGAVVAVASVDDAVASSVDDVRHDLTAEGAAARALLHHLLARCGVPADAAIMGARLGGQPYLPALPGVGVSLTHDAGWVGAAVHLHGSVGVDVQGSQPVSDRLLRRCCPPAVHEHLAALPGPERQVAFARIWSVQEACVKATGVGLAGRPWKIPVPLDARQGRWGDVRWYRPESDQYVDDVQVGVAVLLCGEATP